MNAPRPLVLVAEDEPIASMALRAQLEALGYGVLGPARNGNDAVALGTCFPVEIALLDVRMPGRTGLEAARDLFDAAPTPVVLLTGFSGADLPDPIPKPPVFALLTKPIGLTELMEGIDTARAAFTRWCEGEPARQEAADEALRRRKLIQRAIERQPGPADAAATRILRAAAEEDRSPVEIATDLLAS